MGCDNTEHHRDEYAEYFSHFSKPTASERSIAVARQQGARSYELLAALSLAKLYQSTGRAAEACAILTPALDGFSPTAEMPEINEAQALLELWTHGA